MAVRMNEDDYISIKVNKNLINDPDLSSKTKGLFLLYITHNFDSENLYEHRNEDNPGQATNFNEIREFFGELRELGYSSYDSQKGNWIYSQEKSLKHQKEYGAVFNPKKRKENE